ncbi:DUF1330 domain-containing protein [Streptomyces chryseus]|uniref:DUF1330 domain-containing protein n=1 Tax=Streptomyces chryseus TaxID=68186 RepID=UPI00142EF755|nr:DUF1330 domain-containing protein [Streptomyces chryseus]GGX43989.1 hypothetical protein GCM10010353_68720 [Streptomyces chryseus]
MTAFALFDNIEVTDPAKLAEYSARVREVVEKHGGRYLAVGGQVDAVEGESMLTYPVLIEFPDLAAAHRWYDAPEYQELRTLRQSGSRANATFFETAPSDLLAGE